MSNIANDISRILIAILGTIIGLVVIFLSNYFGITILHFISIPFGLSILGVSIAVYTIERAFTIKFMYSSATVLESKVNVIWNIARFLGGVVGGIVGAIVSSSLWFYMMTLTDQHFGIVAIIVGWAVGTGVLFGSRGTSSWGISVIIFLLVSPIITLEAILYTEYFLVRHYAIQSFSQEVHGSIYLLLPWDTTTSIIGAIQNIEPASLLFWFLAILAAPIKSAGFQFNE